MVPVALWGAEFVARRERERAVRTRAGLHAELEATLTERQLEVLETAYYAGYFRSPRRSTGSDVAESLGVSQPTVSEQLRVAQRKVLDLLFDGHSTDAEPRARRAPSPRPEAPRPDGEWP